MPSKLIETAPTVIYLCVSDDTDDYDLPYPELYAEDAEITWATDQPVACTVRYERSDLVAAVLSRLASELAASKDFEGSLLNVVRAIAGNPQPPSATAWSIIRAAAANLLGAIDLAKAKAAAGEKK